MVVGLYWWRGNEEGKNFGDELSKYTAEFVSGADVNWKPLGKANLFSIGSILGAARIGAEKNPDRIVHVWGTGLMSPTRFPGPLRSMKFAAVRGPLTRSAMGGKLIGLPMGDPGLLIDRVFDIQPQPKKYSVGFVPHFKQRTDPIYGKLAAEIGDSIIIDVGLHPKEVAMLISQCECVVSTSLHGLVVSDALGVPNIWGELGLLHAGGRFKFHDYFLGIRRPVFEPISMADMAKNPTAIFDTARSLNYEYLSGLEVIKDALVESFPIALRADDARK